MDFTVPALARLESSRGPGGSKPAKQNLFVHRTKKSHARRSRAVGRGAPRPEKSQQRSNENFGESRSSELEKEREERRRAEEARLNELERKYGRALDAMDREKRDAMALEVLPPGSTALCIYFESGARPVPPSRTPLLEELARRQAKEGPKSIGEIVKDLLN